MSAKSWVRAGLAVAAGAGVAVAVPLLLSVRADRSPARSPGSPLPSIASSSSAPDVSRERTYPRSVPGRRSASYVVAEGDDHGGHWTLYAIQTLNEQGQVFECLGFERRDDASEDEASSMCNSETRSPTAVAVAWTKGFVYGDTWTGFNAPLGKVVATLASGATVEGAVRAPQPAGMTRGGYVIVMPSLQDVPVRVDAYDSSGKKVATGAATSEPTPLETELAFPKES